MVYYLHYFALVTVIFILRTLLLYGLSMLACSSRSSSMHSLALTASMCICILLKIYHSLLLIPLCSFDVSCLVRISLNAITIFYVVDHSQAIILNSCNSQSSAIFLCQNFQYHECLDLINISPLLVSFCFSCFHSIQSHRQPGKHKLWFSNYHIQACQ